MSSGTLLPAGGTVPCEITVGRLAPALKPGQQAVGLIHYRLGAEGEVSGAARVVVPETPREAAPDPVTRAVPVVRRTKA